MPLSHNRQLLNRPIKSSRDSAEPYEEGPHQLSRPCISIPGNHSLYNRMFSRKSSKIPTIVEHRPRLWELVVASYSLLILVSYRQALWTWICQPVPLAWVKSRIPTSLSGHLESGRLDSSWLWLVFLCISIVLICKLVFWAIRAILSYSYHRIVRFALNLKSCLGSLVQRPTLGISPPLVLTNLQDKMPLRMLSKSKQRSKPANGKSQGNARAESRLWKDCPVKVLYTITIPSIVMLIFYLMVKFAFAIAEPESWLWRSFNGKTLR